MTRIGWLMTGTLLGLLGGVHAAPLTTLPVSLATSLAKNGISPEHVSVVVTRLADGPAKDEPILRFHAEVSRPPASTAKLITTLAILDTHGPDWRYQTPFRAKHIKDGVVTGLSIEGKGDASWVLEDVLLDIKRLKTQGVREIVGAIVLDNTYFAPSNEKSQDFDGRGWRPYNTVPDALLMNYAGVALTITPEEKTARVAMLPDLAAVSVPKTVPLTTGPCGQWKNRLAPEFTQTPNGVRLRFKGRYPSSCGEKTLYLVPLASHTYTEALLRDAFKENGIRFTGDFEWRRTSPKDAVVLTRTSAPLADLVKLTNKFSNNLLARHLFLTLGDDSRTQAGTNLTPAAARKALSDWMREKGISQKDFFMENGSGLSRQTRVRAETMDALLRYGWHSPFMSEYLASLPVTGEDGTMRQRKNAQYRGRIKTGLLNDVRSIGGYLHAKDGYRYSVYAVVAGDKNVHKGIAFLDDVIDWVDSGTKP